MSRIEVAIMELEPREQFTLLGGVKQNRARALFIGLLPPGDTCYTAAEVVKCTLPGKDDHDLYFSHYKALDSLARVHGIGDGKNPGPDNIDPETGKRLPGKKPGTLQACRWTRQSWLAIVSDEMYDWLLQFNKKIVELAQDQPSGTRYFCDLETFEVTAELPAKPIPARVPAKTSSPRPRSMWYDGRPIAGLSGFAAVIFLTLILGPHSRPVETRLISELAYIEEDDYLSRNQLQPVFACSAPLTDDDDMLALTWKVDAPETEMVATILPPRMFIAGNQNLD